jgi:hypothetical protein
MSHLSASTRGAVPSVSLVIPAYNEQATIERALYSAMVQTVAATFRSAASRFSDDLARRILRMIGREHPFLVGCNMAIRADAWRTVREHTCAGDGDRFHEDLDLAIHLREAGVTGYSRAIRLVAPARSLTSAVA